MRKLTEKQKWGRMAIAYSSGCGVGLLTGPFFPLVATLVTAGVIGYLEDEDSKIDWPDDGSASDEWNAPDAAARLAALGEELPKLPELPIRPRYAASKRR